MNIKEIWKAANPKGHLLTAISYLIPIVCGAGFIIAIGMALGGTVQDTLVPGHFDLWQVLATLGAKALGLLPVVIAIGISGSIAGKPGIAPGFVVGLAANAISAGFIGGMIGGYISGQGSSLGSWFNADINRSLFRIHYQLPDHGVYHRHAYWYFHRCINIFP